MKRAQNGPAAGHAGAEATAYVPGALGSASAATDGLTLEAAQRAYVRHVVERHEGNKAAAARAFGITRQTLYKKLGD